VAYNSEIISWENAGNYQNVQGVDVYCTLKSGNLLPHEVTSTPTNPYKHKYYAVT